MAPADSFSGSSDYKTDTSDDEQSPPIQGLVTPVSPLKTPQPESKNTAADTSKKPDNNTKNAAADTYKKPDNNTKEKKKWGDVEQSDFLNSMIEYEEKNNVSPNADIEAFLDYVKKELNVDDDVTKKQLKDKIRRLKNKYEANKGKDLSVMKPNEKAVFELSERVWDEEKWKMVATGNESESVVKKKSSKKRKTDENGNGSESVVKTDEKVDKVVASSATGNESGNGDESVVRKNPSRKRITDENANESEKVKRVVSLNGNENESVVKEKPNENGKNDVAVEKKAKRMVGKGVGLFELSNEEKLLSIGADLFGGDEEVEGSDKWRKLEREEMELYVKQLDVKSKKMRLVLDTME